MNALNRVILKTAGVTFFCFVMVLSYGFGLWAICSPQSMVDFFDTMGNDYLSAVYSERIYKQNPTDANLYTALDKFLIDNNYPKIIEYSEKFFALEDFNEYVKNISAYKRSLAEGDALTEGLLCNEDDRLRTAYIDALLRRGAEGDEALAKDLLHDVIDVVTLTADDFMRPSMNAIFEFGADMDTDLRADFEEYYFRFKEQYDGTPDEYAPKFFVANVMDYTYWDRYLDFFGASLKAEF